MTKFCVDCVHYYPLQNSIAPQIDRCNSPRNDVDLVTGKTIQGFCSVNRNYSHLCGSKANWFEPKLVGPQESVQKKPFYKFW